MADDDLLLNHAASEQYGRVSAGDTVWIVTVWPGGRLVLLARVDVERVVDRKTAERLIGTDDLWDATYHILTGTRQAEPVREVYVSDLASALRFESERDRLTVTNDRVDGKQLQAMRRLTMGSAELLASRWGEEADYPVLLTDLEATAGGFGKAAQNREVELAAIRHASHHLQSTGWVVVSVESQRIGYDLLCTKGRKERHVEVKGVRGSIPGFIITEGELLRLETDSVASLIVVTNALTSAPIITESNRLDATRYHDFTPLVYRATPTK